MGTGFTSEFYHTDLINQVGILIPVAYLFYVEYDKYFLVHEKMLGFNLMYWMPEKVYNLSKEFVNLIKERE